MLLEKFACYLLVIDEVLNDLKDKDLRIIQELGGFLSVISIFMVARHRSIDNWFRAFIL